MPARTCADFLWEAASALSHSLEQLMAHPHTTLPKAPEPPSGTSVSAPPASTARQGISLRAIVIGLLLVVVVCLIVSYTELVLMTMQIGFLQLPPAVIGLFVFLVILNNLLRRLGQRFSLSAAELLMMYCMMLVAAMVSSRGVMEKLIPLLVTSNYYANKTNQWNELFSPFIKKWMVPFNPKGGPQQPVSVHFFERLWAGQHVPWGLWAIPLVAWGVLVLLIVFVFLCMATIMRRQWVDNEKLPFPLVQLPLDLVRDQGEQPLLKNPLLWLGAAIPTLVFTMNGLHNMFPNVPSFTLSVHLNDFLVNPPWNQMYWTSLYVSFAAIGFFYLLPSELLFSLWFFALFARAQDVMAAYYGMELKTMPMYGTHLFIAYQTVGAYVVMAGYLVYMARTHLKEVLRKAFGMESSVDDQHELMTYATAFWGLIIGFALIVAWCCLAGMSLWLAVLEFFVFLFIVALVLARSTAEAGMLMTETSFRPTDLYRMFAPAHALGPANLTVLAFMDGAFMRDQRGLLLTGFLDGLKISDGAHAHRSSFRWVFGLGVLAALLVAGAAQIWLPYTRGANSMYSYTYYGNNYWAFEAYGHEMTLSTSPAWQARVFFLVGVAVTLLLSYLRSTFYWWPLHPLGYALCASWTMTVFWFSCLVAWVVKTLVIRYGGMKLYLKLRPFFLGMVLGEFGMAVIWALISGVTGSVAPGFPWP